MAFVLLVAHDRHDARDPVQVPAALTNFDIPNRCTCAAGCRVATDCQALYNAISSRDENRKQILLSNNLITCMSHRILDSIFGLDRYLT
jgi:hypothetical protein